MKKHIFTLVFALSSLAMRAQVYYSDGNFDPGLYEQKRDAARERILKNHIIATKVYRYDADSNKSDKGNNGFLTEEHQYDEKGNLVDYKTLNKHGRITTEYLYRFDDKGRNIEFTELKRNGNIHRQITNSFDKAGNNIDTHWYYSDQFSIHKTRKYDDKNRMTEQAYFYRHDKRKGYYYTFSYYDDGSKKQSIEYNPNGKAMHTWNYDCAPIGELAREKQKDTTKVCVRFETDKNGNQVKVKEEFVKNGPMVRRINKYDLRDNLLDMESYDIKGHIITHTNITYNEMNQITEYTAYKKRSDVISGRLVYIYDADGNIVKLLTYKGVDKPKYVVKYSYLASKE